MDKTKMSQKQKASSLKASKSKEKRKMKKKPQQTIIVLREDAKVSEHDPMPYLLDTNKMGAAIMECLIENDTEGALEVLENYLDAVNRTQFLKKAKIPRSTAYNMFKGRNPTLKTLAKIMHASAHS